ncbi:dynein regulation protein LC7 [Archaeoglobales archaeon]|nr:MAG: dynein regulation protein LC7 [Archaeoglobales archaeon]
MEIEELKGNIPKYAIEILKSRGIKKLFPPQIEAIKNGLFESNLVVAIPTASGKTLIAELVMIREVAYGGKCLYTVPLRALAMEKFEEFKKWESLGIEIGLSMGDYESKDEWLGSKDIIVTTSEKADSLLRNKAGWINKISCLVVDEIHLLDSAKRGAVLEILIAKLRRINPRLRIIALSATIPNADEIAEWLDARLVKSDWRPTPLYEGVFCKGELELYNDGVVERLSLGGGLETLVYDCLKRGGQLLIFDSTRRNAESTALKLTSITRKFIESNFELSKAVLEENDGEMSQKLSECIANGSAFHHAGLLNSQRKIVEEAFKDGQIKVVVATPTLAAGVNLPARRVIIKSYRRYDGYSKPIKVLEYKQMAGRAGRPGLDERGEAILIAKSEKEKKNLIEKYIEGKVENIMSKLGAENHLRFHSLSLISEGFANSMEALEDFFSQTFFFHQNEISVKYELEKIVLQLDEWEMVEYDDLKATDFGELISKLYIDPLSGFMFHQSLNNKFSEITALHLICRTPDMERLYLRKTDSWVEEEVDKIKNELIYVPPDYSVEYDWFLSEVKTALCLRDWINEIDENTICEKYGIAPGDLRRILETAEWLTYSLARIAQFVNHKQTTFFSSLVSRIKHGVKDELVDLVELKGIGRVRARRLYNAGIKSREDLVRNKDKLAALIGKKIAERVLAQIGFR